MTAAAPLILRRALLPDGRCADVTLRDGRISSIDEVGAQSDDLDENSLDGLLLLPGLIDGHIHLDKTFTGQPWRPHKPGRSVPARVAAEKSMLRDLTAPAAERATALVERVVVQGSTQLRSHVDVDSEVGLSGLEALVEVREASRQLIDIQIVAFPQSGVLADYGTIDLLDAAVRNGADAVGGLDPAGFDGDAAGQLELIFSIADRVGCLIDIHLHDPGDLGAYELRMIAERSLALGLQGRVTVSHAYALGAIDDATFGQTAEALASGGVAILTNGPGPDPIPPIKRLRDAGVTVMAGSDNIRDAWSPYGSGDMLERARIIGYRSGFNTDEDLALAFAMATTHAAEVLGVEDHGLKIGCRADLVAVAASGIPEAVATFPPRALVIKAGQVVAKDGTLVA